MTHGFSDPFEAEAAVDDERNRLASSAVADVALVAVVATAEPAPVSVG